MVIRSLWPRSAMIVLGVSLLCFQSVSNFFSFAHADDNPASCQTNVTSVTPPCLNGAEAMTRLDLPACSTILSATQPKGLPSLLNGYYTDLIQCQYSGYVKSDQAPCSSGSAIVNADGSKAIICSLTDNEGTEAQGNNHLKEACSTPSTLSGVWEMNQVRGLWIQALKFYRNQVLQTEIIQNKSLKIHTACQAIADDYQCLNQHAKASLEKVSLIGNAKDLATACATQNGTQSAACVAHASQVSRILLFFNLAKCEIAYRANEFYGNFVGTQTQQINQIVSTCTDDASSGTLSNSQGMAKFKKCYEPRIRQFFQNAISSKIPGQFQTSLPSSGSAEFA